MEAGPARTQHTADLGECPIIVLDMLEHLLTEDVVECSDIERKSVRCSFNLVDQPLTLELFAVRPFFELNVTAENVVTHLAKRVNSVAVTAT